MKKHFVEERLDAILAEIDERGRVTVKELCDHLNMSIATIRNDLSELEKNGKIVRTHGGAMALEKKDGVLSFGIRKKIHSHEKTAISKAAADLVNDGEVIFIDGGTTAADMRLFLPEKEGITVITPSIEIAYWLNFNSTFNIYLLNGFLNRNSLSTIGPPDEKIISEWNIAKAFCGAAGFTIKDGLMDLHMGFVDQKKVIVQKARYVIGLVDSSKFGIVSQGTFAKTDEIDCIITDKDAPSDMLEYIKSRGISTIIT